jgi:hypothetical protein
MAEISGDTEVHIRCVSQSLVLTRNNLQKRTSFEWVLVQRWLHLEEAVNAEQTVLESTQIVMMEVPDAA